MPAWANIMLLYHKNNGVYLYCALAYIRLKVYKTLPVLFLIYILIHTQGSITHIIRSPNQCFAWVRWNMWQEGHELTTLGLPDWRLRLLCYISICYVLTQARYSHPFWHPDINMWIEKDINYQLTQSNHGCILGSTKLTLGYLKKENKCVVYSLPYWNE